ncbi:sorbitol dehydrogenase-like [Brevipalpus obovatus]|uniref:sorbitol dehydrogenase-like n=1 Tax=Brevipalpus obovatus TaxID=246614 RepID=UPI003D9E31DE
MPDQLPPNFESKENLSAVLHKAGDLRIEKTPLPEKPGKNEVVLKTSKVGICGSDVSYWVKGYIGSFVVKEPMILGHETSAHVVAVGEGVTHLKPGDRVAIEPGVPCRYCVACREGAYNVCPTIFFSATPPDHGTLTRYFKHAADFCYKLPDHVSDEEGALMEPLSVAIHACNRGNIKGGEVILICGAGPIGLMCLLTAKAFGVTNICITDINEARLEVAKNLGATTAVLLKKDLTPEATKDQIVTGLGRMPDTVFECSGVEASLQLAINACKEGGIVVIIGMGSNEVKLPIVTAACKELDIRGCFRYKHTWPKAVNLIASGRIDVKPIITHRFKLEQTIDAFEMAKGGEAIKVVIDCDTE